MKKNRTIVSRRVVSMLLSGCTAVLLLQAAGCSSHNGSMVWFNTSSGVEKRAMSRQESERFWSQVRVTSSLARSHYKLGRYYQQSGKHELAVGEFTKAIRLDGGSTLAYNRLGISLTALERCDEAEEAFAAALGQGEGPAWLYNNFGCSSMLCGEPERALTMLHRAAELDGENPRIGNNLKLASMLGGLRAANVSPAVDIRPPMEEATPAQLEERSLPVEKKEAALSPPRLEVKKQGKVVIRRLIDKVIQACGIEVSNGNGVTGLARRSADFFRRRGFAVNRITNADNFRYDNSMIYYREGYLHVARAVAVTIPGVQEFRPVDDLGRSNVQVRVLLGRDVASMNFPETAEYQFTTENTEAGRMALASTE